MEINIKLKVYKQGFVLLCFLLISQKQSAVGVTEKSQNVRC